MPVHCDKNPGVRPIGIGDVLGRIIGIKVILAITQHDILEVTGTIQLCMYARSGFCMV
jgi:hypothetical protein